MSVATGVVAMRFPVVAVGASAGGLEAFVELLEGLDPNSGMAFVLIQHLDPHHKSLLAQILAKSTTMPVSEVKDGELVQVNHVYVLPPNCLVTIADNHLRLTPRGTKAGRDHCPIDDFCRSLALDLGDMAVGVVLSGTGSDGTQGLAAIASVAGVTFAQDSTSAKFDSMPLSAVHEGVDFVLSPKLIATELHKLGVQSSQGRAAPLTMVDQHDPDVVDMQKILAILRAARGIDFNGYKRPTVRRRIHRRMSINQLNSIGDYVVFLKDHPEEIQGLYEDILVKVTTFFRNPESFVALRQHVIPALLKEKNRTNSIRIWVPGCSTGEEAYSLAICLLEAIEEAGIVRKLEIFATDVSEKALAKARVGTYEAGIAEHVSPERLGRFFVKEGSSYRVLSSVRECCIFAKQNVARDPPFSKLDLISCRNLLIYLSPKVQKQVLSAFHFALNANGFLSLSNVETVGAAGDLFEVVDKVSKIYAKKAVARGKVTVEFGVDAVDLHTQRAVPLAKARGDAPKQIEIKSDADLAVLRFSAPSVVVNSTFEVLQFRGDTSAFLLQPNGEPTTDLLKMCKPGLLGDLRSTIRQAMESSDAVSRLVVLRTTVSASLTATITVVPFTDSIVGQQCYVILFAQMGDSAKVRLTKIDGVSSESARLESDLAETKDYLNSIIEKEQATNEELKSASEEILSANEELQSTNEEIATAKEETQAANEELITVNEELQYRNQELAGANNDLANIFESMQIPIVMLSTTLAIRRYTPLAETVLSMKKTDIGRSMYEVSESLRIKGLAVFAAGVLETLNTKEEDVQDVDGHWFSLRIKPYRTLDNRIDGVVIALVDIDIRRKSLESVRSAFNYAEAIIQTAPAPLLVLDGQLRVVTVNESFCRYFEVKQAETKGTHVYELGNGQWSVPLLRNLLENVLPEDAVIEDFTVDHEFPTLGRRIIQVSARRLAQQSGLEAKILLAFHDITSERRSEEESSAAKNAAEAANQAKTDFLANMSHEIRTPLGAILGYSELLANPSQSRDEALESASRIRKNVEQLTELIDEILDVAKIEAGKLDVEIARFALLPELAETCALLQSRAEGKGVAFEVTFVGRIPESISSSAQRIRQVLLNIGGNALKFTEQGGVYLKIDLTTIGDLPKLRFVISDTGIGLSKEQQARLFKPFSQADNSVTRRYGGSGLGLVLARRLAQALGGDVELTKSVIGEGSTFTVTIDPGPLAGIPMQIGLTHKELNRSRRDVTGWFVASQKLDGLRILLAEDGPDNQKLIMHFLTASGAVVDLAGNGAEAVEKATASTYDLVLMDIQMPVLDGYEATRQLRAAGYSPPIIALTAHAMHGERERCLAAGCVDYITKPIVPNLLVDLVLRTAKKDEIMQSNCHGRSFFTDDPDIGPLVADFVGNLPGHMRAFQQAELASDWIKVGSIAHQMAGAAGGYGFPELGRSAAKVEALAKHDPRPKAIAEAIAVFTALCNAIIAKLESSPVSHKSEKT